MALHLRARQHRLAPPPGLVVKSFNRELGFSRIEKSFIDAMVHFPDAQGPMGEIAEPCETLHRLAFFRGSGLGKDLSHSAPLLVSRPQAISLDESARP